jgi:hypothetical protein
VAWLTVSRLPGNHRHQPADERGRGGIGEDGDVGGQEAERAHQMQGLVYPGMMVVTMIVPPLLAELGKETVHSVAP